MRKLWIVALTGFLGSMLAVAQDQTAPPPPPNQTNQTAQIAPPASNAAVAHVSALSGTVSTQRADNGDWVTGALNAPLVTGDKVAAGAGGRAEIQLDYADVLRLSENSQANLANLATNQLQVQLASGLADYAVLKGAQAASEIDTPNVAVHPQGPGVFRIEVLSDSESKVIVREGEAQISTPQGSTTLKKGQQITVEGTDTPQYQIADAPAQDSWDQWNQQRDHALEQSASVQHTNPYYTGVQALDPYGYWTVVPGYGNVWVPNEPANWAPYNDGNWNWEPNWGWTWVGYEPWGWAPYHYGRWFFYGASWAWWPGPITPFYRPLWAPAYVSFFGFGGGFGFGVGFGGGFGRIGWLPIGPADPFRPWWGLRGGFGGREIGPLALGGRGRIAYSNLDGMLTNSRIRSAMAVESADRFGSGGIGARSHATAADVREGRAMGGAMPAPSRASFGRPASSSAVPHNAATHFFGTQPAARASAQERAGVADARTSGSPASGGWQHFGSGGAASGVATRNTAAGRSSATAGGGANSNWHGFSEGRSSAASSGRSEAAPATRQGWQRFSPQSGGEADARGGSAPRAEQSRSQYGESGGRPTLNMGHPIVQAPRSTPSYGGGRMSGGGARSMGGGARSMGGGGRPSGGGGHGGGGHGRR